MTSKTEQIELSLKQQRFLAALPNARGLSDAAASAGVGRTTVHRWLKTSIRFKSALDSAQKDIVAEVYKTVETNLQKAADKLVSLMESKDERIALRASDLLVKIYHKHRKDEEIEQRLTIIEKTILPDGQYPPVFGGSGGQSPPGG